MDPIPADAGLPSALFPPLSEGLARDFAALIPAVEEASPLPARFRRLLPHAIRDLWSELTHSRDERRPAYLSEIASLQAYLRYFLPWNVYRFCRLLPALKLSSLEKAEHPLMADLGSGPLSLPIALWLSRPELRDRPLLIQAIDRVPAAMEAGEAILHSLSLALSGRLPAWKIQRIHGPAESRLRDKVHLLSAAYFANEFAHRPGQAPEGRVEALARIVTERLLPGGEFLLLDAGEPRAAGIASALRAAFIGRGASILAPCTHGGPCPMPGRGRSGISGRDDEDERLRAPDGKPFALARGKRPWCHFTFGTEGAPPDLEKLSREAGLPKEGAALSLLHASFPEAAEAQAQAEKPPADSLLSLRVVSESFPLPSGERACYACSSFGYSIVCTRTKPPVPGELARLRLNPERKHDPKSGALIFSEAPYGTAPRGALSPAADPVSQAHRPPPKDGRGGGGAQRRPRPRKARP